MDQNTEYKIEGAERGGWLLAAVTIPQLVLVFIYSQIFMTIKGQIGHEGERGWFIIGGLLTAAALAFGGYAIFCLFKKRRVHFVVAPAIVVGYVGLLYLLVYQLQYMFNGNIPRWVINEGQFFVYTGTFIIPSFFYAILLFVKALDRRLRKQHIWVNFLGVVLVPAGWYLFYIIFSTLPVWTNYYRGVEHIMIFLSIVCTVLFYLFLLRTALLIYKRRDRWADKGWYKVGSFGWKLFFALIFPLLGICLNEMWFPFIFLRKGQYFPPNFHAIFGDLSSPLFPILQIATGVLLIIPQVKQRALRLALFAGRSLLFIYSFYLFLVLLPFYPLFIAGIPLFGVGFLIISPLTLLVIHFQLLREDYCYLRSFVHKRLLIGCLVGANLIIPLLVTGTFLMEKRNLYRALDNLYSADYSGKRTLKINGELLRGTLETIENMKMGDNWLGGDMQDNTPYLSPIYQKMVLNNLTLSEDKISYMRKYYFNENDGMGKGFINKPPRRQKSSAKLTELSHKTEYDPHEGLYHTWVELVITNTGEMRNVEYSTTFELPEGAWVEDYYLDVFGERLPGMLVEKKAAQWIYQNVRRRRRDPGLLYHETERRMALRIFPFGPEEVRYSGFKIVHFEPLDFSFDGKQVDTNGGKLPMRPVISLNGRSAYLSTSYKEGLSLIERQPYYHFILDWSEGTEVHLRGYIKSIKELLEAGEISAAGAMVTLAGSERVTFTLDELLTGTTESYEGGGAFALDRALKEIYYRAFMDGGERFPLPVVISRKGMESMLYDNSLHRLDFTYPDNEHFYLLGYKGQLTAYPLGDLTLSSGVVVEKPIYRPVRLWYQNESSYYLPDDGQSSLVYLDRLGFQAPAKLEEELRTAQPEQSRLLNLSWLRRKLNLYPWQEEALWMPLYRESLRSHVLTPLTSFIVLENEMQRKMLLKKEKETLSGKKSLDSTDKLEDVQEMSEPSLIVGLILLVLLMVIYRKRSTRFN